MEVTRCLVACSRRRRLHPCRNTSTSTSTSPLVSFSVAASGRGVRLEVPAWELGPSDHTAVVGSNGSGKGLFVTLIASATAKCTTSFPGHPGLWLRGAVARAAACPPEAVERLGSVDHSAAFLRRHGGVTVASALGGTREGSTWYAGDLVVAFGLYPVWHRPVRALSTGELRKVMLAHAVAASPRVLVLDQPFDGLDNASRAALRGLVSDLTDQRGAPALLVANIAQPDRGPVQVVLVAHRRDEIEAMGLTHLVRMQQHTEEEGGRRVLRLAAAGMAPAMLQSDREVARLLGEGRGSDDTEDGASCATKDNARLSPAELALVTELFGRSCAEELMREQSAAPEDDADVIVSMRGVGVEFDDRALFEERVVARESSARMPRGSSSGGELMHVTTVLHDLDWALGRGRNWAVLGDNGSGKSTLLSLLADPEFQRMVQRAGDNRSQSRRGRAGGEMLLRGAVAVASSSRADESHRPLARVVSMEEHAAQSDTLGEYSVSAALSTGGDEEGKVGFLVASFLGLNNYGASCNAGGVDDNTEEVHFGRLSQGEQRLVLLASAVASGPRILVCDEVCQGLDRYARRRVLRFLDILGRANVASMAMKARTRRGVYDDACLLPSPPVVVHVTHHADEIVPSVTHVLHLRDGRAAFSGSADDFDWAAWEIVK